VCALAAPSVAIAEPRPLSPQEVHTRIQKLGVGNWVGVRLQAGIAFSGKIVSINEHSMTILQYGYQDPTPVAYADVVYLEKGISVVGFPRKPLTPEVVHARLLKRGLGKWVGVQLQNGVAFWGRLVSVDESSFGLQLYGDPETTPVAYNDVVYLQAGLTGGQKALLIGLPVAFTAASIGMAVAFHNNEPKMPTMPSQPTGPIFP
jgi:small nuclear ribonucleoprotein (snRNP)-like protein